MPKVQASKYDMVQKLLRAFRKAEDNNPYQNAVMSSPPTVTVSATSDGTLGTAVALAASNALTSAGLNQVAYYGGVPKPNGKYVHMPVASVAPATSGNLAGYANANITTDMMAWCSSQEIVTDGTTVEFGVFMNSSMRCMLQVDGQYVDKTGVVGAQAGGADNFIKLVFSSRKRRRIRLMHAVRAGASSGSMIFQIRLTATCNFWKPDQSSVLHMAWAGDSYGEGVLHGYETPNAPMAVIAGELLGIRNVMQRSVGGTGYLNVGTGRSKLGDQIATWLAAGGSLYAGLPDLLVPAHGYNDYVSSPSAITTEVLADLTLLRSYCSAPIVVLGSQAGKRGPDATTLAVEAAISAAVTAFNDPLCKFAPVSTDSVPWLAGTGYVGATNGSGNSDVYVDTDQIHPSVAGHEHLGFRAADAIRTAVMSMAA